jgi:hypothetical protein
MPGAASALDGGSVSGRPGSHDREIRIPHARHHGFGIGVGELPGPAPGQIDLDARFPRDEC